MLDDHVYDCPICHRVSEALVEHARPYLPQTLEEYVACTPERLVTMINTMPRLAVAGEDYDHYIRLLPPPAHCECLLINPYFVLERAGSA